GFAYGFRPRARERRGQGSASGTARVSPATAPITETAVSLRAGGTPAVAENPDSSAGGVSSGLARLVPMVRAHLSDGPQLQADPAFALGEIGGAPAVLAARPERHAVGLAQGAHHIFVGAQLLRIAGRSVGKRLECEDIRVLDLRHPPRTIGVEFRA